MVILPTNLGWALLELEELLEELLLEELEDELLLLEELELTEELDELGPPPPPELPPQAAKVKNALANRPFTKNLFITVT